MPPPAEPCNLLDTTPDLWPEDALGGPLPRYRRQQIAHAIYRRRAASFDEMSDLPAELRASLAQRCTFRPLQLVRIQGSADTTRKLLFRLPRGDFIECVLIPASPALYGERSDRHTLCVSSQVGCAYGCKFCASGLEGFQRNLTPGEIVAQFLETERATGVTLNNLVFMGMGEPLANYDNLLAAITLLNSPHAIGLGARHITVSTSGLAPQIKALAEQPLQIRLAISLHGATDAVRDRLMPVNRKYPLAVLMDACRHYARLKKQKITFEYILIAGVNDSPGDADALARRAKPLHAKINLIPYNTVEGLPWRRPGDDTIRAFHRILAGHRVPSTVRLEKGRDIDAACGQLRLRELQNPSASASL